MSAGTVASGAYPNGRDRLSNGPLRHREDYKRMLRDIDAQRAQVQLAQTSYTRQEALLKVGGTGHRETEQLSVCRGVAPVKSPRERPRPCLCAPLLRQAA